jgi:transcriptional regulator with GAF, ATPase, and Fis domain
VTSSSGNGQQWMSPNRRRPGLNWRKAFEEIKRLRDQPHDENVVLREQIDQAFMFEEIVVTSPAFQGVLSRRMKVAPTDSRVLVSGTSHSECQIRL